MDTTFFRGWLGADAEHIKTEDGPLGLKFRIGVSDSYLGRTGEWVKRDTVWVDCEAWRKAAENAQPALFKGCAVVVVGKWRGQSWTTPEGKKRSKNVFHVETVAVDVGAMEFQGLRKRQSAPADSAGASPESQAVEVKEPISQAPSQERLQVVAGVPAGAEVQPLTGEDSDPFGLGDGR